MINGYIYIYSGHSQKRAYLENCLIYGYPNVISKKTKTISKAMIKPSLFQSALPPFNKPSLMTVNLT